MAADRGVPGAGLYGDLPPSYTRSQPPANPDLLRRPSYCHAAFALKQISKVTQCSQLFWVCFGLARIFCVNRRLFIQSARCCCCCCRCCCFFRPFLSRIRFVICSFAAVSTLRTRVEKRCVRGGAGRSGAHRWEPPPGAEPFKWPCFSGVVRWSERKGFPPH